MKGELDIMCNLAEGIREKGIAEGIEKGIALGRMEKEEEIRKMILRMNEIGLSIDTICKCVDLSIEEVQKVLYQFV